MKLHHVPDDLQLPWQWWAPGRTEAYREFAGTRYQRLMDGQTYVAGFLTEASAIRYGEMNGWRTS